MLFFLFMNKNNVYYIVFRLLKMSNVINYNEVFKFYDFGRKVVDVYVIKSLMENFIGKEVWVSFFFK